MYRQVTTDRFRHTLAIASWLVGVGALLSCDRSPRAQTVAPIEWSTCPFDTTEVDTIRVRCGYISVPENRNEPDRRRIRLAFAVIRPAAPGAERTAPYLMLAGGPGGSGFHTIVLTRVGPALAEDRAFVAFDARGVGRSEPTMCPARAGEDARARARDLDGAEFRAVKRKADLACRDALVRTGVDLRAYHSRASADDVEDLRRALGYDQWVLWGVSYGGALAQVIMDRHPASVRAAVLNSPARLDELDIINIVRGVGGTLRMLSGDCKAATTCPHAFANLEADFYAVAEELKRAPMEVAVDAAVFGQPTFTVNAMDFITVIDELTMFPWELGYMPGLIQAFRGRDTAVVAKAVTAVFTAYDSLSFSPGLQLLVNCHDFAPTDADRQWQRMVDSFPLGGEVEYYFDLCRDLPTGRSSAAERRSGPSQIPVLIFSGRFDNRTPPAYSARIMETFRNSRQIVFPAASHEVMGGATWECIRELMQSFARNPAVFPDGSCAASSGSVKLSAGLPEWAR